jgi:hypothetical protein
MNKNRMRKLGWVIGVVVFIFLVVFIVSKTAPPIELRFNESNETLLRIKDIERTSFGTIDDYKMARTNISGGNQESLLFGITRPTGENAQLGTQIIKSATKEESQSLWEVHVNNLRDIPLVSEKDVNVGEKGKIFKITMDDPNGPSTVYLTFYQNNSFVILTMNYAKASDESDLVNVAQTIEGRLGR